MDHAREKKGKVVPLVVDVHPALPDISKLIRRFKPDLERSILAKQVLGGQTVFASFRKARSLGSKLAPTWFLRDERQDGDRPGFFPCNNKKCLVCKQASFGSMVTSKNFPDYQFKVKGRAVCNTPNVVYVATDLLCNHQNQYVGSSAWPFNTRLNTHKSHMRTGVRSCTLAQHFLDHHKDFIENMDRPGVFKEGIAISVVEVVGGDNCEYLRRKEGEWAIRMQSLLPNGFNYRHEVGL